MGGCASLSEIVGIKEPKKQAPAKTSVKFEGDVPKSISNNFKKEVKELLRQNSKISGSTFDSPPRDLLRSSSSKKALKVKNEKAVVKSEEGDDDTYISVPRMDGLVPVCSTFLTPL